jgi:hypothetical protein
MGGGGSKSRSSLRQELDTTVINRSEINILNETINNIAIDAIMKNADSCSAGLVGEQGIEVGNIKARGDVDLDFSQDIRATLTFSCINATKVRNDISTTLIDKIMGNLETSTSTDIVNQLGSVGATKAESGASSFPWNKGVTASSDVVQTVKSTSITENRKNVSSILNNAIKSSFTNENIKKCISKVNNEQTIGIGSVEGENIKFVFNQDMSQKLIAECVNQSDISQKLSSNLTKFFDIDVLDDTSTTVSSGAKSKQDTSAKQQGIIDEVGGAAGNAVGGVVGGVGNAVGGVVGGVGNAVGGVVGGVGKAVGGVVGGIGGAIGGIFGGLFKGLFGGNLKKYLSSCCACILIILLLVGMFYIYNILG